jgi:hypothetical protein
MNTFHVSIRFLEPLLGTAPLNAELYRDYVASKAPDLAQAEQEGATIEEVMTKSTTGFHRFNGNLILYDYVLKGFFKDACGMLRRVPDSHSAKIKAYKQVIDGLLFVAPRQIPITLAGEITILERPLRAQTPQGERVAIARSEVVPSSSSIEFDVQVLGAITADTLREWLDYGALRGLGQWRNASYGRFTYTMH